MLICPVCLCEPCDGVATGVECTPPLGDGYQSAFFFGDELLIIRDRMQKDVKMF